MIISEPLVGFPCYAELTSTDPAGAAAFYGGLFGWTADLDRFLLGGAVVAGLARAVRRATQPHGTKGSAAEGRMGGRVYTQFGLAGEDFGGMTGDTGAEPGWLPHFGTSDVDASVERAEQLGATVVVAPGDLPGTGRYARLTDPQNAAFALYAQPEAV